MKTGDLADMATAQLQAVEIVQEAPNSAAGNLPDELLYGIVEAPVRVSPEVLRQIARNAIRPTLQFGV